MCPRRRSGSSGSATRGRCAFIGPQGRCPATAFLEYRHVVPFAAGGDSSATNLELRCRKHNQYEADRYFGPLQVPLVREARAVYGVTAKLFWNELALEGVRIVGIGGFSASKTDLER